MSKNKKKTNEEEDEEINTEGMTDMLSNISELETVSKLNENENKSTTLIQRILVMLMNP